MLRPITPGLTLGACTRCTKRNQFREVANEQADRSGDDPRIRHGRGRGIQKRRGNAHDQYLTPCRFFQDVPPAVIPTSIAGAAWPGVALD